MSGEPVAELAITELGRYELVRRLHGGRRAELYIARSRIVAGADPDAMVTIKRLAPHLARHPRNVEKFLLEARAVACVDHPNIVRVLDIAVAGQDCYYAREYVRGASLWQLVQALGKQGRTLPIGCAIGIGIELCLALEAVGVVHQSISPSKIMIGYDGSVKLADFGAELEDTLDYISPEQHAGQVLDGRSDLYSIGAVLDELTRYRRSPFVDAIIIRAMADDRARRYATARELRSELETLMWGTRPEQTRAALAELVTSLFPVATVRARKRRPSAELAVGSTEIARQHYARGTRENSALPDNVWGQARELTTSVLLRLGLRPSARRYAIVGALVAGLVVSAWGIYASVHTRTELPGVVTAQPAPTPIESLRSRPDAIPSIVSIEVDGELPAVVVRRGVERALPGLRECYRDRAARITGLVELTFEIERRTPSNVKASGVLAACAIAAASAIRTSQAPAGGRALVSVTISFRPI